MSSRISRLIAISFCALALSGSVYAHEYKIGALKISHPYARATVPGQPSGGAYLSVENTGNEGDKLLSASSPAAKSVEIHNMKMDGNIMKMREVGEIELKPMSTITMAPGGGYHFMLMGLTQALKAGDKFPMTLTFQKAGKIEVSVSVDDLKGKQPEAAHLH